MTIVEQLREAGCIYAEQEAELLTEAAGDDTELLQRLTQRRVDGEPLEHVVGWAEFDGHRYSVGPGVFVPRPRTEAVVEAVFESIEERTLRGETLTLLDLCCGSGALGMALKRRCSGPVELHAADIEPAAVVCAERNLGLDGTVYEGDLFAALPEELRERFDVIIANVPYVPTGDIELLNSEARDFEPHSALDILRRVVAHAPQWLAPGGFVTFEVTEAQLPEAQQAVIDAGLATLTRVNPDYEATMVFGIR